MDNARKKYVNIERLSTGDIFVFFDSTESDDVGDIENIINDSDTEFAAEHESVISTNIIRNEEISDQVAPYQFQELSTFCLPKTRMKPILQIRMNQFLFLPLSLLSISHLVLPLNVLPINVLLISHLLLLLNKLLISHSNLLLHRQLLYPKTPRNRSKAR